MMCIFISEVPVLPPPPFAPLIYIYIYMYVRSATIPLPYLACSTSNNLHLINPSFMPHEHEITSQQKLKILLIVGDIIFSFVSRYDACITLNEIHISCHVFVPGFAQKL